MGNPINSSIIIYNKRWLMVSSWLASRHADCLIDVDTCIFNKVLMFFIIIRIPLGNLRDLKRSRNTTSCNQKQKTFIATKVEITMLFKKVVHTRHLQNVYHSQCFWNYSKGRGKYRARRSSLKHKTQLYVKRNQKLESKLVRIKITA